MQASNLVTLRKLNYKKFCRTQLSKDDIRKLSETSKGRRKLKHLAYIASKFQASERIL